MRTVRMAIAALAALLWSCTVNNGEYRSISGNAWGTVYHITYNGPEALSDSILDEIARVNMSLSAFEHGSTLYRINAGLTDRADSMFAAVFAEARGVWQASGGLFDPTVGPLVKLWGFGNLGETPEPGPEQIEAARAKVGFDRCRLEGLRLIKDDGMEIDFAAVAKGYGVDLIAALLRRNGCTDYMVEVGGEVAASGVNPKGIPWRIRIDVPGIDERESVISLDNRCVATSGNYRNYRERPDGSHYGHTINPLTGYPAATSVISATVVAPRCATADALATALMAMGGSMDADSAAQAIRTAYPDAELYIVAAEGGSAVTRHYPQRKTAALTSR